LTRNDDNDKWSQTKVLDSYQRVDAALSAFANGEIVVVTDDDDRENEGDLFVAASLCTPEKMAFIIRNTSGIVCAPLSADEAKRLHLDPMVAANDAPLGTAFTVSVDVRHGLTTGISAEERNNTVRALANGNSGAADFVRPGHVFPLVAKDGGVLMRSGHTEACIDLCRLAGLPPVGVLSELMNDDGTVMRGPAVTAFAERHKLKQVSIADVIAYRQARDKLVKRIGEFPVESKIGSLTGYAYVTPFDAIQHMAFVYGRIGDGRDILARLHRADIIRDVFGGGGVSPVHTSLERFKAEGRGVLVFLRDGAAGVPTHAIPSGSTSSEVARSRQWREVGLGAQILKDLGITSIRLLTSRKLTYVGLAGFGIEISATVPLNGGTARD
jgi:3,4-dihydroxy 2-butanone 4-phosphate synthase/GTP cyclohydrolase II